MATCLLRCAVVLVFLPCVFAQSGETLGDVLGAAGIATSSFAAAELSGTITSYAVANGDPFLLAYYNDDGSGSLQWPLHVIRHARGALEAKLTELRDVTALFHDGLGATFAEAHPSSCLGSVLEVHERSGYIFIGTHKNPSAGCVIVLSSDLQLRTAVSGRIVAFLSPNYALFRRSEVHFAPIHPMRIAALDLIQNRTVDLYPYSGDSQRSRFSADLTPLISKDWCMNYNSPCRPQYFDADLQGKLFINEKARVVAFQARFDAAGFGPTAEKRVPPRTVSYIFREKGGRWEHREFGPGELERSFGRISFADLIKSKPDLVFQATRKKR
jgi:hypothetical protein